MVQYGFDLSRIAWRGVVVVVCCVLFFSISVLGLREGRGLK